MVPAALFADLTGADPHHMTDRTLPARLGLASGRLTAVVFGALVPIATFVAMATVMDGLAGVPVAFRVSAAGLTGVGVVAAGKTGLEWLERGWGAFLRYLGAVSVTLLVISTVLLPATTAWAHASSPPSIRPVQLTSVTAPLLYPGLRGGTVTFNLVNPNDRPISFNAMAPGRVVSSNPSACPADNVTLAPVDGLDLSVGPSATSGPFSIPGVISMAATAPNGCQGVSFSFGLDLSSVPY